MSIGSLSAHAGLKHARFLQKLLSLTLAFALAVSMVPSVAWAEAENNSGALVADESQAVEPSPETTGDTAVLEPQDPPSTADDLEIVEDPPTNTVEIAKDMPVGTVEVPPCEIKAAGEEPSLSEKVEVTTDMVATCSVLGVDKDGTQQIWATAQSYTLDAGSTAAELSEAMFAATGLVADFGVGDWGWSLNSLTSPFDAGWSLRWGTLPDKGWSYYVNGKDPGIGAGSYVVQAGDRIIWRYGAWDDPAPTDQLSVTGEVIGQNGAGTQQIWATAQSYTLDAGSTAAELSEAMFAATGLVADFGVGDWGWSLNSLTSPFDENVTLGYDSETGKFWQLFINGKSSDFGAGSVVLQSGDSVTWAYSAYGSSLPNPDDPVIDPDASRPNYDSSWPGFSNGMSGSTVSAPTPTQSAELSWSYNFREEDGDLSVSDPLIINGCLYVVVNGELRIIAAKTGEVKQRANTGSSSAYFNRPVYEDGVIVVPSDNGSLAAYTADTLTCVWKTRPLDVAEGESFQSLSSLTVAGTSVYAGFTVAGRGESTDRGVLLCVDIRDGSIVWTKDERATTDSSMGYYWAGGAVTGDDIVIGDDAGRVRLIDGATGEVLSSVDVGAPVRTGIIAVPSNTAYTAAFETFIAVTRDGLLHTIERVGDTLKKIGSVSFSSKSTSTPAVANGKAFVGAVDADGYGTLSIINLETMQVEHTVRGGVGEAQGAPLVSVQGDDVYVYFTCNGRPGGVYGYHLGDESAYLLFVPPLDMQQYSTSSIIADNDGTLYYTNDSGHLFALKGVETAGPNVDNNGTDNNGTDNNGTDNNETDNNGTGNNANLPSAKSPFLRAVSAARTPLAQKTNENAKSENASTLKSASAKAKTHVATKNAANSDTGSDEPSSVNPWAVGGIALGVVGLVCVVGYVVRTRRKNGDAS